MGMAELTYLLTEFKSVQEFLISDVMTGMQYICIGIDTMKIILNTVWKIIGGRAVFDQQH